MTSFICRPLLIIGLLSFGLASLLVPDFARLHHGALVALGVAALFTFDLLLVIDERRRRLRRRQFDKAQFDERLRVFLNEHSVHKLNGSDPRLN